MSIIERDSTSLTNAAVTTRERQVPGDSQIVELKEVAKNPLDFLPTSSAFALWQAAYPGHRDIGNNPIDIKYCYIEVSQRDNAVIVKAQSSADGTSYSWNELVISFTDVNTVVEKKRMR